MLSMNPGVPLKELLKNYSKADYEKFKREKKCLL